MPMGQILTHPLTGCLGTQTTRLDCKSDARLSDIDCLQLMSSDLSVTQESECSTAKDLLYLVLRCANHGLSVRYLH